jgi:phenol/toluene 2-monooxygenase (NADH) P2/A2
MTTARTRKVGVDLQDGSDDNRGVVEAIEADNTDVEIGYMPGLIAVRSPTQIVVRRETVERLLGRPWETHEFQMAIVSYFGNIADWDDDQIVIKWNH